MTFQVSDSWTNKISLSDIRNECKFVMLLRKQLHVFPYVVLHEDDDELHGVVLGVDATGVKMVDTFELKKPVRFLDISKDFDTTLSAWLEKNKAGKFIINENPVY